MKARAYLLKPIDCSDAKWRFTTRVYEPILVLALSEMAARMMAADKLPSETLGRPTDSVWYDSSMATCEEMLDRKVLPGEVLDLDGKRIA